MKPGDFVPSQKIGPSTVTNVEPRDFYTVTTMVGVEPRAGRPKNTASKRQDDARWLALYNQCRADGMTKGAAIRKAAETFDVKFQTARTRYRRLLPPSGSGQ